eukprot:2352228-Rhodomonas_salina.2
MRGTERAYGAMRCGTERAYGTADIEKIMSAEQSRKGIPYPPTPIVLPSYPTLLPNPYPPPTLLSYPCPAPPSMILPL